jgi:hypothetical protein
MNLKKQTITKKILDKRKKIDEFIVDVIMIKVGSKLVWLD